MSDAGYHKRQVTVGRQKRQIEENTKRLCEFVADLPFHKIIRQEMWERQQREVQFKRHRDEKVKS